MRSLILPLCLIVNLPRGSAQQITLPGAVVIQNSAYETGQRIYVAGTAIRAPFAKAVSSDKQGQFELTFAGIPSGTPVRITAEKPGLEVVNSKELETVFVGRGSTLHVVMADAKKLAEAQVTYYNIATTSITNSYEKRMLRLEAERKALQASIGEHRQQAQLAIDSLTQLVLDLIRSRDRALGDAQTLARTFAVTDLDEASALHRQAFELFRKGEVDSALFLLNEQQLEAEIANAERLRSESRRAFDQARRNYELRAEIQKATLDFEGARRTLTDLGIFLDGHPDDFNIRTRIEQRIALATVLTDMGRYGEAVSALQEGSALYGPDTLAMDPLLAEVNSKLGSAYGQLAQYNKALQHHRKDLRIRCALHGEVHGSVATSCNNLGVVYKSMTELDSAAMLHRRALAIYGQLPERDEIDYSASLNNLAMVFDSQGRYDTALTLMEQCLATRIRVLGPKHPRVALAYNNISTIYSHLGRDRDALEACKQGLSIRKAIFGPDHPDVAQSMANVGSIMKESLQLDSARFYLEASLDVRRRLLGNRHLDVVYSLFNLAGVEGLSGAQDSALVHLSEALSITRERLGPKNRMESTIINSMAVVLRDKGQWHEASDSLRKGIVQAEFAHGHGTSVVAIMYYNLASSLWEGGVFKEAMVHVDSSLAIRRRLPNGKQDLSGPLLLKGKLALALGDPVAAKSILEEDLEQMQLVKGAPDPNHATTLFWLAQVHEQQARWPECIACCDKAMAIIAQNDFRMEERSTGVNGQLAICRLGAGARAAADSLAHELLKDGPNADAEFVLGTLALDEGKPVEALERARAFLQLCKSGRTPIETKLTLREKELVQRIAVQLDRKEILAEFGIE